jgi:hypothetical protein
VRPNGDPLDPPEPNARLRTPDARVPDGGDDRGEMPATGLPFTLSMTLSWDSRLAADFKSNATTEPLSAPTESPPRHRARHPSRQGPAACPPGSRPGWFRRRGPSPPDGADRKDIAPPFFTSGDDHWCGEDATGRVKPPARRTGSFSSQCYRPVWATSRPELTASTKVWWSRSFWSAYAVEKSTTARSKVSALPR